MAKSKSTEKVTGQAGDVSAELVTPAEHTETTDAVIDAASADIADAPEVALTDVASPAVPDDVEVAARSADMSKASTEHRKVFVLGPSPIGGIDGNPYTEARGFDHEPNKRATRQYMIEHGLWPTSDVSFVSGKRHPDGESWVLTYAVEAIPAHNAPEGSPHPEVVGQADVVDGEVAKPTDAGNAEPVNAEPTA